MPDSPANLREKLRLLLPTLLPKCPQDAIHGNQLIARLRSVIGNRYTDSTLRTQFSMLMLEENSCLARVAGGQGYYLRSPGEAAPTLQDIISGHTPHAESPRHRIVALAIRLYDTPGHSIFAYPVDEQSWLHPDLVSVHWPPGQTQPDGTYVILPTEERQTAVFRAVCIASAEEGREACRCHFFRTLSCGSWAQECELFLFGPSARRQADALSLSAAQFGVGLRCPALPPKETALPTAEVLLRMNNSESEALLQHIPQHILSEPRRRNNCPPQPSAVDCEVAPVLHWTEQCLARGRVEAYERRVAIN